MLFSAIQNHAEKTPDKIALWDEKHAVIYGDLMAEIKVRAENLADVGVMAIALDNCTDWVLWDLAALKAKVPCVPLPPFFSDEQVFHVLRSAGVTHILDDRGMRSTGEAAHDLPEGTAKITFTSGTTGTPKGVCLSRDAMESVAHSIHAVLGDKFVGTHACVLPLAVLLENVAGVYAGLMAGCTIALTHLHGLGENYTEIHSVLKTTEAISAILVPEILRILMAQVADKGLLPDLKFVAVGGSKVDPALITTARNMGLPVYEGYGLSECASVVALNTPQDDKPATAGKILPHLKARIIEGEIHIKNKGFLGYIGEAPPKVIKTGDLGTLDDDGFLSVTGRRKNVLITSYGRNISPEWIESVLLSQPEIAQAIVFGDAQSYLEALIVPSAKTANLKSAVLRANARLPDYAHIEHFTVVLPFTAQNGFLTGTGRPKRDKILNHYRQEKIHELLQRTA